jgi:hypothetical protein
VGGRAGGRACNRYGAAWRVVTATNLHISACSSGRNQPFHHLPPLQPGLPYAFFCAPCPPGSECSVNNLTPCAGGTANNLIGAGTCAPCEAGTVSNSGAKRGSQRAAQGVAVCVQGQSCRRQLVAVLG